MPPNSFEVRSLPVRCVTGGITQYVVNPDILGIISSRERGIEFWDLKKSSLSPGPLRGARVAVAFGVGMLPPARFVEDVPWWGQDSLTT